MEGITVGEGIIDYRSSVTDWELYSHVSVVTNRDDTSRVVGGAVK